MHKLITAFVLFFLFLFETDLVGQVPSRLFKDSVLKQETTKAGTRLKDATTNFKEQGIETVNSFLTPEKKLFDSLLQTLKQTAGGLLSKQQLFTPGKNIFTFEKLNFEANYTYLYDSSGVTTGNLQNLHSVYAYHFDAQVSFWHLPFHAAIQGNNGLYNVQYSRLNTLPQFNFDHRAYTQKIKSIVATKVKPEAILANVLGRINSIKVQYEAKLLTEINQLKSAFAAEYGSMIELPADITNLSVNDVTVLKTTLFSEKIVQDYQRSAGIYQQILNGDFRDKPDSAAAAAKAMVVKFETLNRIYERVIQTKSKFDNNPLVKELRAHLPFDKNNYQQYLSKPSNLLSVVKSNTNLSSFQRLFLQLTKLDLGVNPIGSDGMNIQSLMNTGINTMFTGKKTSVGFIYGMGQNNINPWVQNGLNRFTSNEFSNLTGLRFGSGSNSALQQTFSLNFFNFSPTQYLYNTDPSLLTSNNISSPARRDAVLHWQSEYSFMPNQRISIELSKSFGSFNNSFNSDSSMQKKNAFEDVFTGTGHSNYAASLAYEGDILHTAVGVTIRKAGLGYNNPGNIYIRRGETFAGLQLNRKIFKQKLTLQYKAELRYQPLDPLKNTVYKNQQHFIRAAYRIKRNSRFGLTMRVQQYAFIHHRTGNTQKGQTINLQGDGNYSFKIGKRKVMNHASIMKQSFVLPALNGEYVSSNSWLGVHSSTIVLNKNLLTVTLVANKSDQSNYLFSTSFLHTEAMYGYSAGSNIRLSSGAGYYLNEGWNQQIGIRQQISGTVFKKFTIEADVNWKQATRIIRSELANQVFVHSSIIYSF